MSCSASAELRRARPLLGTIVQITLRGGDAAARERAVSAAFAECAEVHARMSFHEGQSDVTRLNREAARAPVVVDPRTWRVLERAQQVAEASAGAFDVTIAPTLVAWGYLPGREARDPCAAHGYQRIELLSAERVRFHGPIAIDLGGIAKGFAVDRMCEVLLEHGFADHVVNAGGDLRVGSRPELVHVRHPARPTALLPLVELHERALATSGPYFEGDGVRHPIAVPRTRRPAELRGSVSVLSRDCILADALTKVVAVLGGAALPVLERFAAVACRVTELGEIEPLGAPGPTGRECAPARGPV